MITSHNFCRLQISNPAPASAPIHRPSSVTHHPSPITPLHPHRYVPTLRAQRLNMSTPLWSAARRGVSTQSERCQSHDKHRRPR